MSSDTFYIKEGPHFKLWVSLRYKIVFEAALINEGISFHIDDSQSTLKSDIRYFLADAYREQVDAVVKYISVAASTDSISVYDPEVSKKVNKMYLTVVAIVIMLLVAGTLCFGCKKNNEKENQYFSNFDEVIHYQISDTIINEIWTKRRHEEIIGKTDSLTMWFVNGWREGGRLDKNVESRLRETKFIMRPLDTIHNFALRDIFKENRIATYRNYGLRTNFSGYTDIQKEP